jgi:hypothetical protein
VYWTWRSESSLPEMEQQRSSGEYDTLWAKSAGSGGTDANLINHLMLEKKKVSRKTRDTAVAKVDSKVKNSIIVDAGQVAQSVLYALQEFAGFSPISSIDG